MLVGPVHHEEVLARSSQRKLARSNIHTSMTGCAITGHSLNAPLRRLFGMLRHRVNASNAGQAPGGRQHTSCSTSYEGQRKVLSRM